jgi:hypothetical protein
LNTYGSGTLSTSSMDERPAGVFAVRHVPPPSGLGLTVLSGSARWRTAQSIYVDSIAVAEVVAALPGRAGAGGVQRRHAVRQSGDRWDVAAANNRATGRRSAGRGQAYFDRWFDMRGLGLQLPYVGDVQIADTLITA